MDQKAFCLKVLHNIANRTCMVQKPRTQTCIYPHVFLNFDRFPASEALYMVLGGGKKERGKKAQGTVGRNSTDISSTFCLALKGEERI